MWLEKLSTELIIQIAIVRDPLVGDARADSSIHLISFYCALILEEKPVRARISLGRRLSRIPNNGPG